ncbi:PRC-barrel domain-containing protein [uncultured Sphingomonas sp.]|uniref:PRC-barrel domain-containing protein n=1 Tax=uncultured Sphingomonas sp. TaxID=158754 RepID=UPI0035C9E506
MEQISGWVALVATCTAALMTAANLGARVTGWGFVVFTVGSIGWSILGMVTGQQQLLLSNIFLTLVNLLGIWRWLGRQAKHTDGGRRAMKKSERAAGPSLLSASELLGGSVSDADGDRLGTVVDAMMCRADGRLVYLVASRGGVGGVGEDLHPLDPDALELTPEGAVTRLTAAEFAALPVLEADRWPSELPAAARYAPTRGPRLATVG